MKSNKKLICISFLAILSMGCAYGQSGTNSPYSQFGLGSLSDQTSGFNRGMNGLGLGFREHNQVNYINPASYSAVDSLSFIFDLGMSGQITNFKEGGVKKNANNADFEYAVAAFRAAKHVGVSFGIIPFTNVGYSYSSTQAISGASSTGYTNSYSGEGGLHQVYVGAGWEPFRGFSFGANFSYLWGSIDRVMQTSFSDGWVNTLTRQYSVSVTSYKLDFGLQQIVNLNKGNLFVVGVTYGLGHSLGATPSLEVSSANTSTGVSSTTPYEVKNGLKIPHSFGAGLMWENKHKVKLGFDYSLQKWGNVGFPTFSVVGDTPQYAIDKSYFSDRQKFTFGGEFCADEYSRDFLKRMKFRAGVSYANSYYKINGQDGPDEISVSAGFGIPIVNSYNNRSVLNISGQWVRSSAKNFITESTFRINIGLTFNERWFMKWKVE